VGRGRSRARANPSACTQYIGPCSLVLNAERSASGLDLTDAIHVTAEPKALATAAWTPLFDVDLRRALVARTDAVYDMARKYASLNENCGHAVRVFREMDAARAWLSTDDARPTGAHL
jgi:hypothetical protein